MDTWDVVNNQEIEVEDKTQVKAEESNVDKYIDNITEFIKHLIDSYHDELNDVDKYNKMADMATMNNNRYSPILKSIAKEESIHAKHLKSILNDIGIDVEEE